MFSASLLQHISAGAVLVSLLDTVLLTVSKDPIYFSPLLL